MVRRTGKLVAVLALAWVLAATVETFSQGLAGPADQAVGAIQGAVIDAVEYYHAGLDHYFVTAAPGEIVKLDAGTLPGWQRTRLSFRVFDPAAKWSVEASAFLSKSRNTPFGGWELTGRAVLTVVEGSVVWEAGAR